MANRLPVRVPSELPTIRLWTASVHFPEARFWTARGALKGDRITSSLATIRPESAGRGWRFYV
jgi:hypothetical protein